MIRATPHFTLIIRAVIVAAVALSGFGISAAEVAPGVLKALQNSPQVGVLIAPKAAPVRLDDLPDVSFEQRMTVAVDRLRAAAELSQASLLAELRSKGVEHRAFWVSNAVWARVARADLEWLQARADVRRIDIDAPMPQRLPRSEVAAAKATSAIEWGVQRVNAPAFWARGFRGQGVVIGGQDTGYQWNHPALRAQYRGWDGVSADHNYHWHDAIHALTQGGSNICGVDAQAPCDDNGHGTHTMGSMVGDDGVGNQIGVAPAARWIGCRNMERGDGRPATYLECFQWFMAPTDLAGNNPDPGRAPHIINNSWGCPPSEGCSSVGMLRQAVENLRNAGILVVVSAGNSGPSCGTIDTAPSPYAASFSVAASDINDDIAVFSSRGPGAGEDPFLAKPDITAPGVQVRSSVRNGAYGNSSGTSMAGPHVAGVAALLMSMKPHLRGRPAEVESLLRQGARATASNQSCGEFAGFQVPNAVFGYGIVDVEGSAELVAPFFINGFESPLR